MLSLYIVVIDSCRRKESAIKRKKNKGKLKTKVNKKENAAKVAKVSFAEIVLDSQKTK